MKWRTENQKEQEERVMKWHKYFAWYPVFDGKFSYWLCYVERRATHNLIGWRWEYREVLK